MGHSSERSCGTSVYAHSRLHLPSGVSLSRSQKRRKRERVIERISLSDFRRCVCECVSVHVCVYVCVHVYVCMFVCMCMCMRECVYVCMRMCVPAVVNAKVKRTWYYIILAVGRAQ